MTSPSLSPQSRSVSKNERGLTGLVNIGNTCFLNSIVQCLSNTKPLLEYILNHEYIDEIRNPSRCLLIKRYADLINGIWGDQKNSLNTHSLKNALVLYAPRFSGFNQHDAQEFLKYLLQGLHNEINRAGHQIRSESTQSENQTLSADETWRQYLKSDNSKVVQTFGGLMKSVLKCTSCGFSSTIFEPFWDLSLSIPLEINPYELQKVCLSHCLDYFTKEEVLDGNEKPTCSKCKSRQTCIKRISIQRFPQILVIHLKRFSAGGNSHKVEGCIDFPIVGLNMGAYTADTHCADVIYNLYGVVNHYGTMSCGHYTANCKHPYSGDWHRFNDRVVMSINPDATDKSDAYILFYEALS